MATGISRFQHPARLTQEHPKKAKAELNTIKIPDQAAWFKERHTMLMADEVEIPIPSDNEILIKVDLIAFSPFESKIQTLDNSRPLNPSITVPNQKKEQPCNAILVEANLFADL